MALLVFSALMSILRYRQRYWTSLALRSMIVEAAVWLIGFGVLALNAQIINPEIASQFSESPGRWWGSGGSANLVIWTILAIVMAIELVSAWRGHRRYKTEVAGDISESRERPVFVV